jgi:hypothetical protein
MAESNELNETDRDAARRALARNWPELKAGTAQYAAMFEALTEFHRLTGTEKFDLRYNLRPPKDRTEEWTQQFMHGRLTEDQLHASLKADAERPLDIEMLTAFHNAYQDNLAHFSGVLQHCVPKPSEERSSAWKEHERAIDGHISVLRGR